MNSHVSSRVNVRWRNRVVARLRLLLLRQNRAPHIGLSMLDLILLLIVLVLLNLDPFFLVGAE
ncbi:hypothetical protein AALP_AA6G203000 [Arabis alpina]|uniref:Uncharacterized protein n=1 Tax=Arabis alpina TaxID=50452 RepID=A0A087GQI5_ARAAL|nr:hypothetical protein AALP_AA6G203000 [Arabis alpina]